VAGKFQRVDLSENLCVASADFSLAIGHLKLVHEHEVLPESASAHAAQSDRAISRQSHIHVEDVIGVDVDDLVHLVLHFVQHSEGKSILARVFVPSRAARSPHILVMLIPSAVNLPLAFLHRSLLPRIALEV